MADSVFKRLSLIRRAETDKDLKRYWMPDENCKTCYDCGAQFTMFRRRHHCRICGQIFCSTCCSETISTIVHGRTGDLRCCKMCHSVAKNKHHSTLEEASALPELAGRTNSSSSEPVVPIPEEASEPAQERARPLQVSSGFLSSTSHIEASTLQSCVVAVRRAAVHGLLDIRSHSDTAGLHKECFPAATLVNVLVDQGHIRRRAQGVALGQQLLEHGYFEPVRRDDLPPVFKDDAMCLLRLTRAVFVAPEDQPSPVDRTVSAGESAEPAWLKSIEEPDAPAPMAALPADNAMHDSPLSPRPDTSPHLHDEFLRSPSFTENSRRLVGSIMLDLRRTSQRVKARRILSDVAVASVFPENPDDPHAAKLHAAANTHLVAFVDQSLQEEGLTPAWRPVVLRLLRDVAVHLRPSMRGTRDKMDVRAYVKIKCLPDSNRDDSEFRHGALFTKNVAHKSMMGSISNPKIFFLRFPIEFTRKEKELVSLEKLEAEELEFMKNFVAKLTACRPDVILVQRTVCRIAQDLIRDKKVTLLLNVKESVMDYAARLTGAEVLSSFDQISEKALGTCREFRLRRFTFADGSSKTLTCLDGCQPSLGCTILLRGAPRPELARLKRVLKFLAYVTHSLRLETAFLDNEGAIFSDTLAQRNRDEIDMTRMSDQVERFRKVLNRMVLSTSPSIRVCMPFLYTPPGLACPTRRFLPDVILQSQRLALIPTAAMSPATHTHCSTATTSLTSTSSATTSLTPSAPAAAAPGPAGSAPAFIDCFKAEHHQSLEVLFSFSSLNKKLSCQPPTAVTMHHYGAGDLPLGRFIEQQFASEIRCPTQGCTEPYEAHFRTYVHHRGCLTVSLTTIPTAATPSAPTSTSTNPAVSAPLPAAPAVGAAPASSPLTTPTTGPGGACENPTGIVMSCVCRCEGCNFASPFEPVEAETWDLSLAKFLELAFYAHDYAHRAATCTHALHRDLVRVFMKGNVCLYFEYKPIVHLELSLPAIPLPHLEVTSTSKQWQDELGALESKGRTMVEEGTERVQVLESLDAADPAAAESVRRQIADLRAMLFDEQKEVMEKVASLITTVSVHLSKLRAEDPNVPPHTLCLGPQATLEVRREAFDIRSRLQLFVANWNQAQQDVAAQLSTRRRSAKAPAALSPAAATPPTELSSPIALPSGPEDVDEPDEIASKRTHRRSASAASGTDDTDSSVPTPAQPQGADEPKPEKPEKAKTRFTLLPNSFTPRPLPSLFPPTEHHALPRTPQGLSVYEDQPSSIIAYALASSEYMHFIDNRKEGAPHFQHPFADRANEKSTDFYCQIFFAREFRELRQLLLPDDSKCEQGFVASLARCARWHANGGKSGAHFSKTEDQRYVIKQMSRPEATSVIEFTPNYLTYARRCVEEKQATSLAKIVGVFRVGFKNALTGGAMRQDVIVMENLFYGRQITRIFDLKGSMRSRYAQKTNEVLLDLNLLESLVENPLFLRAHSKVVLDRAMRDDTDFLATNAIMDYSLLVGIDAARNELVVGIIDYIRTFTWDKRLEMYVKSSGMFGTTNTELASSAGVFGAMPTVVSPKVYKTRFTEAMNRYFLVVPSRWTPMCAFDMPPPTSSGGPRAGAAAATSTSPSSSTTRMPSVANTAAASPLPTPSTTAAVAVSVTGSTGSLPTPSPAPATLTPAPAAAAAAGAAAGAAVVAAGQGPLDSTA